MTVRAAIEITQASIRTPGGRPLFEGLNLSLGVDTWLRVGA